MILRGASVLLAVALAASCGGTGRAAASPARTTSATPSPTPLIDVNDMMGVFPPATFFVVTKDSVRAIALLNHATRYTISVASVDAQVAATGPESRVYVLDQVTEGARLRWFDLNTGTERASRVIGNAKMVRTGTGHGGLAIDNSSGTLYALLRDASGTRVDEFDWFTLRPSRTLLRSTCFEPAPARLVAAAGRVALSCFIAKDGRLLIADGSTEFTLTTRIEVIALAMLGEGTLMAGDAQGRLIRLARHQKMFEEVSTLKNYGKGLIRDGIAANGDCCFYFGVPDPDATQVQVRVIAGGTIVAFPTSPSVSAPTGGLFVQPPFAYYVINGRAQHTDINQGFSEIMADLDQSAVPGAVANR